MKGINTAGTIRSGGSLQFTTAATIIKDSIACFSAAHLCFIESWSNYLIRPEEAYFEKSLDIRQSILALFINIVSLALLFLAINWIGRRWRLLLALSAMSLCMPFAIVGQFSKLHYFSRGIHGVPGILSSWFVMVAVIVGVGVWVVKDGRIVRILLTIMVIIAPFTLATTTRFAVRIFRTEPKGRGIAKQIPNGAQDRNISPPDTRVVWILFDEMDETITFDKRPNYLRLPELNRLRGEAIFASNAHSPANSTLLSVPALTTGLRVTAAAPWSRDGLKVRFEDSENWRNWSDVPNVFERAKAIGVKAAIAGWYHPYCRLFSVDNCEWYPYSVNAQGGGDTFGGALVSQLWSLARPIALRRSHIMTFNKVVEAAMSQASDRSLGFAFVHLPVPHGPGIYDSERGRLTLLEMRTTAGYLQNIALADSALGLIRREMEAAGIWSRSWIIVSSDHGWRGSADDKSGNLVPFIVKPPFKIQPEEYAKKIETLISCDMIIGILAGQIKNAVDARSFMDQRGV